MPNPVWQKLVDQLRACGIAFAAGLTDAEVSSVESEFGFRFPPDLREFLQTALPVSDGFPNWRSGSRDALRKWLAVPREGVLFDIEYNAFWLDEWGPRPNTLDQALEMIRPILAAAPMLIPVYKHRMLPERPHLAGNPVFSVHQTDIIYYGADLCDYLQREFLRKQDAQWSIPDSLRQIDFWDIERFQDVRWSRGYAVFDNRSGTLPDLPSDQST
ncbi:SMI1/KNR4 family protein [Anatilimnocola floriformis]|uniref:SMI1/KNR4 family protein n=1 Tax=Anatilimnocola floriformis TaxID=2948575 RepID=UPI0020C1BEDD|nr:SMI1/KNR4 family protein [Anatilimnocola floriformis]